MNGTTAAQIIVDIMVNQLQLNTQQVWLREQNRTIPNDNQLYIAVGLVSAQTISNNAYFKKDDISSNEIDVVIQQEVIQIDVLSSAKSNLALMRNWEVIAALQSFYSQGQQDKYQFKIFRIPRNLIDTSSAEGGSMLQRYSITVICHVWYSKTQTIDYFNDFNVRVDDEKTIGTDEGIVDFEVTPSTPKPIILGS